MRILLDRARELCDCVGGPAQPAQEERPLHTQGSRRHHSVERAQELECLLVAAGGAQAARDPAYDLPLPRPVSEPPGVVELRRRPLGLTEVDVHLAEHDPGLGALGIPLR